MGAAWLLAVPVLCMGGVITHACECASESADARESGCAHQTDDGHETHCDHQTGCGHEGGCPDDPCSIGVLRLERQGDDVVAASLPAVPTPIILPTVNQPLDRVRRAGEHESPSAKKLPFLASGLPLLI